MSLKSFSLLLFCFIVIDYVVISYNKGMWHDLVGKVSSISQTGSLIIPEKSHIQMIYGLFAWFLLVLGMYVLILNKLSSLTDCIVWGIFYGLVVYGVFNFTNMALFPDIYSWDIAWRDILSGTISCSLALLAFYSLHVDSYI